MSMVVTPQCDGCGLSGSISETRYIPDRSLIWEVGRQHMADSGWTRWHAFDFCPECSRKLEGKTLDINNPQGALDVLQWLRDSREGGDHA